LYPINPPSHSPLYLFHSSPLPSPSLPPLRYLIDGEKEAINPKKRGTKLSPLYELEVEAGEETVLQMRLTNGELKSNPFGANFDEIFEDRLREADDFYKALIPTTIGPQQMLISRQAYAGTLRSGCMGTVS
jgi:hypothetical protein